DGDAIFVDLEKVIYGSPAIDLAHATVYTSTMWDPDVAAALDKAEIAAFYDAYFGELPPALAQRVHPWCTPLRRLTWLRTITWCAKWKVVSRKCALSNDIQYSPDYILSVQKRVDDYFDPGTISEIRAGFDDY
ncbi:MAG: aminoglycoside phosphotransferase, partial [Pseudomonadota bacterium]|nr:aminoglycoside phosphotransferase [Pseudomonadota bacterium]